MVAANGFRRDDLFAFDPAAIIRVVVQLLFIGIGWLVWKRFKPATGFIA